jgi:hydroxypyruvate reductase
VIRNRDALGGDPARDLALDCLVAGIRAADPATVVPERVSLDGAGLVVDGDRYDLAEDGDVVVLGGGKAAGTVAEALEGVLGDRIDRGAVVTNNPRGTDHVEMLPGDHPVPSVEGAESTRELLALAESVDEGDLVVAVVTGGASALLSAPAEGLSVADLQAATEGLLASGASIDELNAVRKHLSALKGGRLAAALAPATVVGLVFSDVVGDRLDVVASGPLAPDATTYGDAQAVLGRNDVAVPEAVTAHLAAGAAGDRPETPDAGDSAFDGVAHYVLANGDTALSGAAEAAREAGVEPLVLGARVRGESREAANALTGVAESVRETATPVAPPAVVLSGGETTVTLRGDGVGGPNQEFVLSAALALAVPGVTVAAVDTDGVDGAADAAGGIATRATARPVREARAALGDNDAGGFLERRGCAIHTGQTSTNVNDLRVLVVREDEGDGPRDWNADADADAI